MLERALCRVFVSTDSPTPFQPITPDLQVYTPRSIEDPPTRGHNSRAARRFFR